MDLKIAACSLLLSGMMSYKVFYCTERGRTKMMVRPTMENNGKGENRKAENLLTLIQLDGNGYLNHKNRPIYNMRHST